MRRQSSPSKGEFEEIDTTIKPQDPGSKGKDARHCISHKANSAKDNSPDFINKNKIEVEISNAHHSPVKANPKMDNKHHLTVLSPILEEEKDISLGASPYEAYTISDPAMIHKYIFL
jgi:hypothetical protein